MKRVLCVVLLALMLLCAGCSGNKATPKSVVSDFSIALRDFDLKKMESYLVSPESDEEITEQDIFTDKLASQLAEWAKSIEFEITDVVEANDSAKVTVKYKHIDTSAIAQEVMAEYVAGAFASAFNESNDSNSENDYFDMFFEKAKSANLGTTETIVVYDCTKVDGNWKIKEVPKDAAHVMTSNALKLIVDMVNAFNE